MKKTLIAILALSMFLATMASANAEVYRVIGSGQLSDADGLPEFRGWGGGVYTRTLDNNRYEIEKKPSFQRTLTQVREDTRPSYKSAHSWYVNEQDELNKRFREGRMTWGAFKEEREQLSRNWVTRYRNLKR